MIGLIQVSPPTLRSHLPRAHANSPCPCTSLFSSLTPGSNQEPLLLEQVTSCHPTYAPLGRHCHLNVASRGNKMANLRNIFRVQGENSKKLKRALSLGLFCTLSKTTPSQSPVRLFILFFTPNTHFSTQDIQPLFLPTPILLAWHPKSDSFHPYNTQERGGRLQQYSW